MTELTSLRTDVGETRTVAVESEDPELVQATRRELGLDALPNVSFPRGNVLFAVNLNGPYQSEGAAFAAPTNVRFGAISTILPRYMTAIRWLMCSTTARS